MDIIEKAFYDSMFAKQREQEELAKHTYTIEKEKNDILAKPQVIEAAVSNLSEQYSPTGSSKKSRKENYGLDTVENSKAEDDPTRGMGYKIRDDYTKALMDQKYAGVPAGRLLQGVLDSHLKTPGNDGMSTLEKSYNYTRTEGSKFFGTSTKPMPGYDEWYADKRAQEKADVDKESWIASPKDILESAGIGAALQGAAAALGGGAGGAAAGAALGAAYGTALMPGVGTIGGAIAGGIGGLFTGGATTFAGGALLGAVEGAAGEILAQPLKKLLHKTDWYQGMVQSNSKLDNLKALATDALTYVPGGVVGNTGLKAATKNALPGINIKEGAGSLDGLFEGKAPAGPGINIGGESVLSNPPPRLLPYEPTKMTTKANGILYDSEGRIILQPIDEGGPILGKPGVVTPELPAGKGIIYAGENRTTSDAEVLEITKLIGYENRPTRPTGLINLDENITKDLPEGLSYKQKESPRLLEDKLYREPAEMEEFSRKSV